MLDPNAQGTFYGVDWRIEADGTLVIGKRGETQTYETYYGNSWPWLSYANDITGVCFEGTVVGNGSYYNLFSDCSNMVFADLSNFNTSSVDDIRDMFRNCSSLTEVDLSHLDTGNIENFSAIFMNCSSLTSLDLSKFDTGKAKYIDYMFYGCTSLKTIYVSDGWNVNGAPYSNNMFYSCDRIVGQNGTTYSSSATNKARAVVDGESPGYLTYKDASLGLMAYAVYDSNDNSLVFFKDGIGKYYNNQVIGTKTYYHNIEKIPSSQYYSPWNEYSSNIQTVRFDDEIRPTNTSRWFSSLGSLETPIDLTNLDTQNTLYMNNMFEYYPLSVLDVSSLDTSNVTNMSGMFSNCSNTEFLDVSGFDTSNVTNMSEMFSWCSNIEFLDVSGFDTSNVTNMSMMFYGCSNVTELDVSNFDTANVTDMAYMFEGCYKLTTLNLSNFDTINVTRMERMFMSCNLLKTIYASDKWNTDAVTESDQMFSDCQQLIGGNGTTYNYNYVDKTRAKIDGGATDPGYLTYKAPSFTVTFNANGGINAPDPQNKASGVQLILTTDTPTREGYEFVSWNTEADGSGTTYQKGGTYSTDESITLYAQWEESVPVPTGVKKASVAGLLACLLLAALFMYFYKRKASSGKINM